MTGGTGQPPLLLEVNHVQKAYASLRVLEDVTFTLPQGQALGVLGPNGAGKSTLLSVIAGVEKTTGGSITYRGEDVTGRRADDRCRMGIGRTYQIPRPFSGLTVFENALVGAQRGAGLRGSAARTAALEAVDAAGLSAVANATAGSLPLLQRKRLELARALATGPQLLLLDEIAGGLTDAEAGELVASVMALKARGMTLVWIEHVVKALVQVVDRLICLAGGVLVADGAPDDVLASRAVAEVYLGTPA